MTSLEIANELVAGCSEDRARANLDRLYSDNEVSVEAMEMGGDRETSGQTVVGPFCHEDDRFAVIFGMDTENKTSHERHQEREVAVYHLAGGKIMREFLFYAG